MPSKHCPSPLDQLRPASRTNLLSGAAGQSPAEEPAAADGAEAMLYDTIRCDAMLSASKCRFRRNGERTTGWRFGGEQNEAKAKKSQALRQRAESLDGMTGHHSLCWQKKKKEINARIRAHVQLGVSYCLTMTCSLLFFQALSRPSLVLGQMICCRLLMRWPPHRPIDARQGPLQLFPLSLVRQVTL